MRIKKILTAAAVLTLMAVSHAPHAAAQGDSAIAQARDNDIKVAVVNRNWLDVRVYAVSSSHTVRLGTVSSFGEAVFTLPRTLQAGFTDLRLAIRPIGKRGVHYTTPILASPGDIIEFRVENHLALSNAIVY